MLLRGLRAQIILVMIASINTRCEEALQLPKLRHLKIIRLGKKEDIRVHDSAFFRLNVIQGKLMFVIRPKRAPTNSYAIDFKSIFLNKVRKLPSRLQKEIFKQENKRLTANGAEAKLIGFQSSEDLMSTYYNNNNQQFYFATLKNVYKEEHKLKFIRQKNYSEQQKPKRAEQLQYLNYILQGRDTRNIKRKNIAITAWQYLTTSRSEWNFLFVD